MVDTVVDLNFNNVSVQNFSGGAQVGTFSGQITVDYTAGTATPTNLVFTPSVGSPVTISSLILAHSGGNYQISAGSTNTSGSVVTAGPQGFFQIIYPDTNQLPSIAAIIAATPGAQFDAVSGTVLTGTFGANPAATVSANPAPCFAAGTRIRTERGEVEVEALKVGDLVFTSSGASRPIVWLGHREIRCSSRENARDAWPIRVSAGAFGEGKPERDLYLSPAHAVCVDCVGEIFIPIGRLVNGATIAREVRDEIDYWHVELESHDVIFAEGLKTESYLANNNRDFFVERRGAPSVEGVLDDGDYCRPLVDRGPALDAVRAQLEARAEQMGFTRSSDLSFRLRADGVELTPLRSDGSAVFLLPKGISDVRLLSSTFVPSDDVGVHDDARELGVCLHGMTLSDGRRAEQIAFEDPRLAESFFPEEADSGCWWRWTREESVLPSSLFADFPGAVTLTIACETQAQRGWRAPATELRPRRKLYAVS